MSFAPRFAEIANASGGFMRFTIIDRKLLAAGAVIGIVSSGCGTAWFRQDAQSRQSRGRGAGSEQVRLLQQRLHELNYDPGPVDGKIGPQTRGALRDFQNARGLGGTGRVDAATLSALNIQTASSQTTSRNDPKGARYAASRIKEENPRDVPQAEQQARRRDQTEHGMTSEGIRQVQRKLRGLGYFAGVVDGEWGPQTEAALRDFQQAHDIQVTGRLDDTTLDELGIAYTTGEISSRNPPGDQPPHPAENRAGENQSKREGVK
jgi:peptidoglycan hydrolase-like protein with peptidoglycan-binding domain